MKKLGFIMLVGFALTVSAKANAACGTFEVAKGDIKVQSAGKVVPVSTGGKICSGDTVLAGAESRAKIKMADGNELNISPDSKIMIEDYQFNAADNKKKVLLNILKGKVRATTREENMYNDKAKDGQANTFQIRTKSAVAGVRGTDFLTSYDPSTNKTGVVTFRGKVEFGTRGAGGEIKNAVSVGPGLSTTMVGGQLPEPPKPVSPSELKSLNSETRAESAGGTGQDDNGKAGAKSEDKKEDKKDDAKNGDKPGERNGEKNGDKNADKNGDKKDQASTGSGSGSGSGPGTGTGMGGDAGTGTSTGGSTTGGTAGREPSSTGDCCSMPPPPPPPPQMITGGGCPGGICAIAPPPQIFTPPTPPPAALTGPAKVNISINVQ